VNFNSNQEHSRRANTTVFRILRWCQFEPPPPPQSLILRLLFARVFRFLWNLEPKSETGSPGFFFSSLLKSPIPSWLPRKVDRRFVRNAVLNLFVRSSPKVSRVVIPRQSLAGDRELPRCPLFSRTGTPPHTASRSFFTQLLVFEGCRFWGYYCPSWW